MSEKKPLIHLEMGYFGLLTNLRGQVLGDLIGKNDKLLYTSLR